MSEVNITINREELEEAVMEVAKKYLGGSIDPAMKVSIRCFLRRTGDGAQIEVKDPSRISYRVTVWKPQPEKKK